MNPVNNKSLLHFIFDQMGKLDRKEIDVPTAIAQSSLLSQANKVMAYELKRAEIQIEISEHNREYRDSISIREVEAKPFDNTI